MSASGRRSKIPPRQRIVRVEIEDSGDRDELDGEERLPSIFEQMVGPDWRLAEWYRVEDINPDAYVLEFVFVPATRTRDERRHEAADRAAETVSAALNRVLSRPKRAHIREQIGTR